MEPLVLQSLPLGVPFDQKWELLKSTIERLYIHENRSLSDVIKAIKDQYGFDATATQYKYQIKKWNLKKNLLISKKLALCQTLQTRAQQGKASIISRGGQGFDTKNLRRYMKTERRRAITLQPNAGIDAGSATSFPGYAAQSGNRIFINWNMPYEAIRSAAPSTMNHASPLSDILVTTPTSPHSAPSPMATAIREMTAVDRARLFVQGRHIDLLQSMETTQRVTMSMWMYQYWFFAFKTAKHWGRGPQDWTATILGFEDYHHQRSISITASSPPGMSMSTQDEMIDFSLASAVKMPPSLCRWSIHGYVYSGPSDLSPYLFPAKEFNLKDEENWPTWPRSCESKEFTEKLSDSLKSNAFSNVRLRDLPVAVDHIVRAVRDSPNELLEEALGFSIISRNVSLVESLLNTIGKRLDVVGLFPFHLAISYLDGSKICCSILDALEETHPLALRKFYVNNHGHTVLDQMMITILKSHTSCLPDIVDVIFRDRRFEGEEVNICGRWDADSDCIRTLLANDNSGIPFEWKHMFCHTSAQTICHCIGAVFGPRWGPDINTPSGLFVRRCSQCRLELKLLPLHTLILIGFHLSRSGCEKENLFGVLACLLCLLSNGANPVLNANISVQALLGNEEDNECNHEECNHEELDPAELAEKVTASLRAKWSRTLSTGWQVICNVLGRSQALWKAKTSQRRPTSMQSELDFSEDEMSTDEEAKHGAHLPANCPDNLYHDNFFGSNKVLASLWAAVQTELLTHRRLKEGDEWISQNFNMQTLNEGRGKVDIALVQKDMMKPFCDCGRFPGAAPACPVANDAAAYHFSNMDDRTQSTHIAIPYVREDLW